MAMTLAVLWNVLLAWRSISFSLATEDSIAGLIAYLDKIAGAGSFLVAGALAYFFVSEEHGGSRQVDQTRGDQTTVNARSITN
jgi:hypothetical protein